MKRITKTDIPEVLELLPEIEKYGGKIVRGEELCELVPDTMTDNFIKFMKKQQNLVIFPNGYGASIIRMNLVSYGYDKGLMELAIIRITDKEAPPLKMWDFYSNNPITGEDYILGCQSKSDILKVLKQISELDPHEEELSES